MTAQASMTPARIITAASRARFAAALVSFADGSIVSPEASRFAAGPVGARATGVGGSIGALAAAA